MATRDSRASNAITIRPNGGSNYYSFFFFLLNCTVYKARTSGPSCNNFRPSPPLHVSTRLRSFSIPRRRPCFHSQYFIFTRDCTQTGGGIHPFAPALKLSDDDSLDRIDFIRFSVKAATTWTRPTSPLTSIISCGFFSLSLSLSAASSLVRKRLELCTSVLLYSFGCIVIFSRREEIFRRISVSTCSCLVI